MARKLCQNFHQNLTFLLHPNKDITLWSEQFWIYLDKLPFVSQSANLIVNLPYSGSCVSLFCILIVWWFVVSLESWYNSEISLFCAACANPNKARVDYHLLVEHPCQSATCKHSDSHSDQTWLPLNSHCALWRRRTRDAAVVTSWVRPWTPKSSVPCCVGAKVVSEGGWWRRGGGESGQWKVKRPKWEANRRAAAAVSPVCVLQSCHRAAQDLWLLLRANDDHLPVCRTSPSAALSKSGPFGDSFWRLTDTSMSWIWLQWWTAVDQWIAEDRY